MKTWVWSGHRSGGGAEAKFQASIGLTIDSRGGGNRCTIRVALCIISLILYILDFEKTTPCHST